MKADKAHNPTLSASTMLTRHRVLHEANFDAKPKTRVGSFRYGLRSAILGFGRFPGCWMRTEGLFWHRILSRVWGAHPERATPFTPHLSTYLPFGPRGHQQGGYFGNAGSVWGFPNRRAEYSLGLEAVRNHTL